MITRRSFLATCATFAATGAHAGPCWNHVLRHAHHADSPPYAFPDGQTGIMRGILVDLLDALAEFGGFRIDHAGYPLARAQNLVSVGAADIFCLPASAQRMAYAYFAPTPIMTTMQEKIFFASTNPNSSALAAAGTTEELYRFTTVSLIGDERADTIWRDHPRRTLVSELETMINMMVFGHADFVLADPVIMNFKLREMGLATRVRSLAGRIPARVRPEPIRLGLRKSFPDAETIVDLFDQDIRKHITPSLYRQVTARYGPTTLHSPNT